MSGERSVSAGRDMKGNAIATGDFATATATYSETVPRDLSVDLCAELAALRQVLAGIGGVNKRALTRLDEAEDEAGKAEPDPGEIRKLVTEATSYARTANGFMEQAGQLAPSLMRVGGWLGQSWSDWASSLGL